MQSLSTNRPALLQMSLAMLLSGSIGVLVVESGAAPATVVFFRCIFGALALGAFLSVTRQVNLLDVSIRTWSLMALSGLTMAANWVFFFRAYEHASISTVTIVYHLYPFMLIAASVLFFGERVRARSVNLAIIAFVGVFVLARSPDDGNGIGLTGILLTTIAMTFYATTLLLAKRLVDVPPELTSTMQLVVGAVILLPFQSATNTTFQLGTLGILLTLGVIHTGLLYVLLYGAVQKLNMASVALLSFLYPATALVFDALIYDIRPGPLQLVGIGLILFAVTAERASPSVLGRLPGRKSDE